MKKIIRIFTLITLIATLVTSLASCDILAGPTVEGERVTVVIEERDGSYTTYEIDLADVDDKSLGAYSLLAYLKENKGLVLDAPESTYGIYVNAIGNLIPDFTANEYVAIYTSVERDFSVPTADFPVVNEVVYNVTTLKSAGVGISSMSVDDGAIILFRIEKY